ncbi:MAG: hypothetical protein BWZ02_01550 [Lentisphaerae bacterium ADurb.BinA184]|nr:MAG: hypothetical protein BWZ02_01550 [Lentisphaerae bacterium ADurb.BinA184]
MRSGLAWAAGLGVAVWAAGSSVAWPEGGSAHRPTPAEIAEQLADPSANITYVNISYRAYMDAGLENDDVNQELRLNGAGFIRLPDQTSVLYRAFLPLYATEFPCDDEGVGDALLSAYWVPTTGSLIVGAGGALIMPTASEDWFGTGKWSAGPTLVLAKKVPGKYTVGGLLTHVWSFAGEGDREDVSLTTIQPAVTYFLGRGTSATLTSEATYNWEADEDRWQIPVTVGLSQILPPFGNFFVGVGLAGSYYIEKADYVQEWDLRAVVSVVFP